MTTHTKQAYWKNYFDEDVVNSAEQIRQSFTINSTGTTIHIDVFEQDDRSAPTIVFNHGGGGYSRMFTALALAMHSRGYTIVLPDQIAQGLSGGTIHEMSIDKMVRNIVDAAEWARKRYSGRLILSGGSLGSGLTYHASAAGAPADLLICHNLYAFGNPDNAIAFSTVPWARHIPIVPQLVQAFVGGLAKVLPNLVLPYRLLGRFSKMADEKAFFELWLADPVPLKQVTLGYLNSMFTSKPNKTFEENVRPILVINPIRDQMVSPAITYQNFARLGGDKTYREIPYGHWSISEQFTEEWCNLVNNWLREQLA